jgi:hypothetical protein
VLVDGTLARTWDWTCRTDLYSGKHRDTGFNLQIATTLTGRLLAVGTPIPGARHDAHAWAASGLAETLDGLHVRASRGGPLHAISHQCRIGRAGPSCPVTHECGEAGHGPQPHGGVHAHLGSASLAAPLPAPEVSTWSTRSAASMNDVDTDQRRHTLTARRDPCPANGLFVPAVGV